MRRGLALAWYQAGSIYGSAARLGDLLRFPDGCGCSKSGPDHRLKQAINTVCTEQQAHQKLSTNTGAKREPRLALLAETY